jgi:hypothetical protein
MTEREYSLVEIIRDPRMLVCEASEITRDGHYYLYRYNATEGNFYRATVPSGAASVHFQVLESTDKIPLGGWKMVVKGKVSKSSLHLVSNKGQNPAPSGSGDPKGKKFRNNMR